MEKHKMSCIDCAVKNCDKMDKTYPEFCLTTHMDEAVLDADGRTGGTSEIAVGKGIAGCREQIILATKVRYPTGPGPNDCGLTRRHILQAAEASLRRLNTDYIDIYGTVFQVGTFPIQISGRFNEF